MRLAPRSLFSRLVLVQLSVLVAALLASFAIHMHERGEALSQASGMQAAQRIADIVKLLEPLPPEERRRIVRVFSAPPLTISLDQRPLADQALDSEAGARSALFDMMLRRFLGDRRPTAVSLREVQGIDLPAERMKPGMAHPPWMAPGAAMHFGSQPGFSFVAQVRLNDGALVTFDSRQPAQTAGGPSAVAQLGGATYRGRRSFVYRRALDYAAAQGVCRRCRRVGAEHRAGAHAGEGAGRGDAGSACIQQDAGAARELHPEARRDAAACRTTPRRRWNRRRLRRRAARRHADEAYIAKEH